MSNPLRILFALPGLHRVNRGAEVVLEEVARRVATDPRFDVTMFGSGPQRPGEPYLYRKLRCTRREIFEKFPKFPYVRDHYAWEELSFAPSLYWNYSAKQFDVTVTCGYPYTNWILRSGRKKSPGRPAHVFITQNGDWMVQANNWEYKHFSCDGLICTNPEYYERHKDRYPCVLIPNGVDVDRFGLPKGGERESFALLPAGPVILIVSALIPSKHVLEGVRAAAGVPGAQLVVAGDGEQRAEVDALGRELLGDRFRRLVLPRERMPDLYRAADVLLHMSQDEPFGNIYIEALATGLPVVAHDTPVTRWILQDQATLLDTNDSEGVTRALRTAVDGGSPSTRNSRRALAEARFSWAAVARQYSDFFHNVFCRAPLSR